jgi:hypothetical protein
MKTQWNTSIFLTVVILTVGSMASQEANAASPAQTQQFKSSSGKTVIEYYAYNSGPCGAGLPCNFRDSIKVPAGFDQGEVFLSGFKLEAAKQSDAVYQVMATVTKHRYEPLTGALELSIAAVLDTRSRQNYSYNMSFVVILTGSALAKFTPVNTGCSGIANCRITRTLPATVPAGMHYIGLATQNWHLGSNSGPLLLNTLSVHHDGLGVNPPLVNLDYLCVMQDGRGRNRMFCEWAAKVIAFDPAEMEQNGSPIFPQYTFMSWGSAIRHFWTESSPSPSHKPIAGFLNAFEGLTLTYQTFPYKPGLHSLIWLIESSAGNFRISGSASDTALTEYGIFLGTEFGNYTTAQKYGYQESRTFGFLRYGYCQDSCVFVR